MPDKAVLMQKNVEVPQIGVCGMEGPLCIHKPADMR